MKASQMMNVEADRIGPVKIGIIVLALATAIIHGVLLNRMMIQFTGSIDILFTLNALGFLALLVAYFLPQLRSMRNIIRWVLIGFTAVTILAWVFMGERNTLGYATKLIEAALIGLLLVDMRKQG